MAQNECPSVAELLNGVKSLTRQNDGTFQTAWSDSFPDAYHCCEQGGFIYVDFPVPSTVTRAWVTRAPKGVTMNQRTTGPNAAIDLNNPGIQMNNVILAANFHTHPLSSSVGGDPQPSRADMTNAYARGMPGIVVSRDGIYSYGPERRENTSNPKGYPEPVTPPSVPRSTLAKRQPPPWVVSNQWPEGTGVAIAHAFVENEATADANASGPDVIYVEWSDEGVVYGEPLIESED
ncbi:uncharacterized protein EV420DRAFT_1557110 [Desarmillaria tabescens]|uniref:DUF4329 domain-containing protein n=1 Tax=Armillaria tabescens TaxID=1929756 RepID=A0AA39K1Z8_ARMTA|nr:uncharacterized protein EV420DRAFT_1557110 [Desarmillaria tabescens]KAK0452862.1 hypothetical protein EV420DRAFT_1557110 [Desarmillaria tabescens]